MKHGIERAEAASIMGTACVSGMHVQPCHRPCQVPWQKRRHGASAGATREGVAHPRGGSPDGQDTSAADCQRPADGAQSAPEASAAKDAKLTADRLQAAHIAEENGANQQSSAEQSEGTRRQALDGPHSITFAGLGFGEKLLFESSRLYRMRRNGQNAEQRTFRISIQKSTTLCLCSNAEWHGAPTRSPAAAVQQIRGGGGP